MKRLLLIALITPTRVAVADVPAPPPPPAAACSVVGAPIFESDELFDEADGVTRAGTITRLYANGTWTRIPAKARDRTARPPPLVTSCLDKPTIAKLRAAIAGAPWRVTHRSITCRAYSARHTVYFVDGARIIDERTCGADGLDERSYHALELVRHRLDPESDRLRSIPGPLPSGD